MQTRANRQHLAGRLSFLIISLAGCAAPVIGDVPASSAATSTAQAIQPAFDARARALLSRMNEAYKKAKTLTEALEYQATGDKGQVIFKIKFDLALRRGDFMRVVTTDEAGTLTTISDGQNIFSTHSRFKNEYEKKQLRPSPRVAEETLRGTGLNGMLLNLWTNDKLAAALLDPDLKSLTLGKPDMVGKVPVETVVFQFASAEDKIRGTSTLFIDQNARLLKVFSEGQDITGSFTETELHHNVQLNPEIHDSTFKFTPLKGAKLVASVNPNDRENQAVNTRPIPSVPLKKPAKDTTPKRSTSR